MKTAILIPGAFNPPTNAHLEMGKTVHNLYPEADIWYVPGNDKYVDGKNGTTFLTGYERFHLLREAVLSSPATEDFFVSPIEVNGKVDGYTYHTVEYFKNVQQYEEVYLCLGIDNLQGLINWYHAKDLVSENKILLLDRNRCTLQKYKDYPIVQYAPDQFISVPMPKEIHPISSTQIRQAFYQNDLDTVKELIPSQVYHFLCEMHRFLGINR